MTLKQCNFPEDLLDNTIVIQVDTQSQDDTSVRFQYRGKKIHSGAFVCRLDQKHDKLIKQQKKPAKKRVSRSHEDWEELSAKVLNLRISRKKIADIAKELNIKRSTVNVILK